MKKSVLFAQIIFGGLGLFFLVIGIYGQLTFHPSIWYSGPQPIIMAFISLPLVAVAVLLNVLHEKDKEDKKSKRS